MKKSILVASLLVAGVAIADSTDITCDNVLGVLPVYIPSNRLEVILSVPWVQPGGTNDLVAISNLVKTAGLDLSEGENRTTLSWYSINGSKFYSCYLDGTTDAEPKYWKSTGTEEAGGLDPVRESIAQGDAIVLSFTNDTVSASTVYVIGQVGTNSTIQTTIPGAENSSTPTYTLVAPPCGRVTPIDLNDLFISENIVEGDIADTDEITVDILSGLPARYVRKAVEEEKKWVFTYTGLTNNAVIPAGRGFWYKRSSTDPLVISWPAPSK